MRVYLLALVLLALSPPSPTPTPTPGAPDVVWAPGEPVDEAARPWCVAAAFGTWATSAPRPYLTPPDVGALYWNARQLDGWPAGTGGTTLPAAATVLMRDGWIGSWSWTHDLDKALAFLSTTGPVVIAMPWTDAQFTLLDGELRPPGGYPAGWHSFLVYGRAGADLLAENDWRLAPAPGVYQFRVPIAVLRGLGNHHEFLLAVKATR